VGFLFGGGATTGTAVSIAHDMTALCRGRGSCAGFLDAPVRRMINATLAAAVARAGALSLEGLTSADGFGGYGAGGNFSRGSAPRASASPEFWAAADALVTERCAGRMHVMASELVRPGDARAGIGAGSPAADAGGTGRRRLFSGGSGGGSNDNNSRAASLIADPLSGRGATAAAARAADDAIATGRAGRAVAPPANAESGRIIAAALAGLGGFGVGGGGGGGSGSVAGAPSAPASSSSSAHSAAAADVPAADPAADPPAPAQPAASGRPYWRPLFLTDFFGAADAADGAAASAFIPIFSSPSITTTLRSSPAADGMLVQSLPCPPGVAYCVRISAALPDAALVSGTQRILAPDIAPGMRVPLGQSLRQWQARALTAPSVRTSRALVWLGEREAEAWAVEVGLASAARVAELRSAAEAAVVLTEERGTAAAASEKRNGTRA